jgi:hypothetical protein
MKDSFYNLPGIGEMVALLKFSDPFAPRRNIAYCIVSVIE